MPNHEITSALIDQFERSWQELRDALVKTPAEEWRTGEPDYLVPARLAYHIVFTADIYATHWSYEAYKPRRKYKLDWEDAPVNQLPSREALFTSVNETEVTVKEWLLSLGDDGLLDPERQYPWTGETRLGRALYLLRHNQWHIGELNAILRARGLKQIEW
ncbi:MAG: DinB family protein [Anaerolineae bacterium]|nr:DinB family protein [Anaerolineae bacterium]